MTVHIRVEEINKITNLCISMCLFGLKIFVKFEVEDEDVIYEPCACDGDSAINQYQ